MKILKLLGVGVFLGLAAVGCEEDKTVFGDKSLASTLSIVSVKDSAGTYDYGVVDPQARDTTYRYFYLKTDSVFGENGTFERMKTDSIFYNGKTARLYELDLILLPKHQNRLYIHLESNARWTAPTIPFSSIPATWIRNALGAGIGDAIIDYEIRPRSTNPESTIATRRRVVTQYITTRDSLIMYKLNFSQKSMIEE